MERSVVGVRSFPSSLSLFIYFPDDVAEALVDGKLILFKPEQLALLAAKRLGLTEVKCMELRTQFLRAHLHAAASYIRLKTKVEAHFIANNSLKNGIRKPRFDWSTVL